MSANGGDHAGILPQIERAYMAVTGAESPHGARAWLARVARVHPYTVSRWVKGTREPQGPTRALIDLLETAVEERSAG